MDTVIDADFVSIPLRETFTNKFHLDDALTGGLKITIAYIWTLRPSDVFFLLVRPDGLPFHSNSIPRVFNTSRVYKQIKINLGAEDVVVSIVYRAFLGYVVEGFTGSLQVVLGETAWRECRKTKSKHQIAARGRGNSFLNLQ